MSDTPMGRIVGKWPGDETDEEINEVLEQSGKCQKCQKLEDLLRWRKWPEEVPDSHGFYVTTGNYFGLNYYHLMEGWQSNEVVWWKAIGPLPGGE